VDEAVDAIRHGDFHRATELARISALQDGLLTVTIADGHSALLDFVRETLIRGPQLAHASYAGRTLLHTASAVGDLTTVQLLLSLGADPDAADGGGHTPLYCVGNQCKAVGGGNVVRALVRGGANVNAHDGVKRCAALHMAARRDNVEVAEALLDCGADIEARDTLGDTSLRRAVNCGKIGVASLLLARGADLHPRGSKGLTPLLAARTSAMRRLLQSFRGTKPLLP
jgi:ankyrin repeat protein